jgi:uncharacterized RDD family membrane protein YckC
MKNIEIKTTQNVVLQYELAELRDRIVAFIIDAVCIFVSFGILFVIGLSILSGAEIAIGVFSIILMILFMFYSLAFEVFNKGQSIGKMAMRIQVIKTAGGHATFSDYVARWVFRLIDIYFSFGGIASILIASSSKSQRIGDIVANTAVVKLVPKMNLNLNDILTIHSQDSYKPVYTQARYLKEEDVLLIKSTLDRCQKFKNEAHDEAMKLLSERIVQVLAIDNAEGTRQQFLKTILNDYVVLTR